MAPQLSVSGVSINFGGIQALQDVSFDVERGQIYGLIGPNGAGKTTIFNLISRIYTPDEGSITINGVNLLKASAHRIPSFGIARTFQNVILFPSMSVRENLLVGAHSWMSAHPFLAMIRWPTVRRDERRASEKADWLLDYLSLTEVAARPPGDLPFPTRKRVELARALMAEPKLMLLDEPAGGLTHNEVNELSKVIVRIRDEMEVTILLVEHHMNLVMGISDRICVLDFGEKIAEGVPTDIQQNPAVIRAYLGESTEEEEVQAS